MSFFNVLAAIIGYCVIAAGLAVLVGKCINHGMSSHEDDLPPLPRQLDAQWQPAAGALNDPREDRPRDTPPA